MRVYFLHELVLSFTRDMIKHFLRNIAATWQELLLRFQPLSVRRSCTFFDTGHRKRGFKSLTLCWLPTKVAAVFGRFYPCSGCLLLSYEELINLLGAIIVNRGLGIQIDLTLNSIVTFEVSIDLWHIVAIIFVGNDLAQWNSWLNRAESVVAWPDFSLEHISTIWAILN